VLEHCARSESVRAVKQTSRLRLVRDEERRVSWASALASCPPFLLTRSREFCLRMQTCQLFDECFILLPLPTLCSLWVVRWKQSVKFTSCCATRVNCLVRLCQDSSSLPGYAETQESMAVGRYWTASDIKRAGDYPMAAPQAVLAIQGTGTSSSRS
jgi:hypothetical protein